MNWGSWGAFWDMGGQAWYVWGSYGLVVVLMLAEPLLVLRRAQQARAVARRVAEDHEGGSDR